MDFITGILQSVANVMFSAWGPLIFCIVLAVLVIATAKGWVSMKSAVIAAVCCVVFFSIPAFVHYGQQKAAANLNFGSGN